MASTKRSKRSKRLRGEATRSDSPVWQPLLDLVGTYLVGDFMWMFEVELEDGRSLHAYKHWRTRRYIHLTTDGHAFVYEWSDDYADGPSWYQEVESIWLLELVLPRDQNLENRREFQAEAKERARQDSNL
jgi:hypothetical protein